MKRILFLAVFSLLYAFSFAQVYYVSHTDIYHDKELKITIYHSSLTVDIMLGSVYDNRTGAYLEFSDQPRYYVMSWLKAQNPAEHKFIVIKDKEFQSVTLTNNTITMFQLNNNPRKLIYIYHYQLEPVTEEWLNKQVKE